MVNALDLRCGGTSLESRFERFPDFILFFGTHKLKGDKGVWGDFRIGASSPQFSLCHIAIGEATFYQAPYDATRVTSMKTSLKNRLRILSNHFVIILGRPVT